MFTSSTATPVGTHISEYYKIRYFTFARDSQNRYSLARHSDTLAGPDRIEHTREMGEYKILTDAIAKCAENLPVYVCIDGRNHRVR